MGNFRGRKLSQISRFESHPWKFSPWNSGMSPPTYMWFSIPRKFYPRIAHFLLIRKSFLPQMFSTIRYPYEWVYYQICYITLFIYNFLFCEAWETTGCCFAPIFIVIDFWVLCASVGTITEGGVSCQGSRHTEKHSKFPSQYQEYFVNVILLNV